MSVFLVAKIIEPNRRPPVFPMRLLNTTSLQVEEFSSDDIPNYAILSHRWKGEEVTFQDLHEVAVSTWQGIPRSRAAAGKPRSMGGNMLRLIPAASIKQVVQSCPKRLIPCLGGIQMRKFAMRICLM